MVKTGILCHGRHLQANNWELHQFGDAKRGLLGQILKTVLVAYKERPDVVVFGTGSSERSGFKESEYTIKYMFDHFEEFALFPQFNGIDLKLLRSLIKDISIAETKSQNTFEEIKYAAEIFSYYNIGRTIIVSNPDHISRCMQLAHHAYQENRNKSLENLFAVQSEVGYNGTSSITSKIIEMPHRRDDPSPDLSKYIGNYFKLSIEDKKEFVGMVEGFLKK